MDVILTGGSTPGTALNGNLRTPAANIRAGSPAITANRPGQNPLNTVAAATTRPSRFMQGAARDGPRAGQVVQDEVPAEPARDSGTSHRAPPSGEFFRSLGDSFCSERRSGNKNICMSLPNKLTA